MTVTVRIAQQLVVAIGLFATVASAQQATPPAYIKANRLAAERAFGNAFAANIFSDSLTKDRQEFVARSLRDNPAAGCSTPPTFTLTHVNPLQSDATGKVWSERFGVDCQPKVRRNWIVVVPATENIKTQELFPGDTIADVKLQRDMMPALSAAAGLKRPVGCQQNRLITSQLVNPPSGTPMTWNELWIFDGCGTKIEMEVRFATDPKGGTNWTISAR